MEYETELFTRPDEIKLRKKIVNIIKNYQKEGKERDMNTETDTNTDTVNTDINIDIDIDVGIWQKKIKVSNARSWPAIEKYKKYRFWAEKNGLELYPSFKRELIENDFTDETYEEITFPIASIGIYKDDDLEFVFPSREASKENYTYYKIGDFMNSIKNNKVHPKLEDTVIEDLIEDTIKQSIDQ